MVTRLLRSAGAAVCVWLVLASSTRAPLAAAATCGTDLKLLVIAADGSEPSLGAIRRTLDYLGTPYELFLAVQQPAIAPSKLSSGCRAFYQGVILTTAELGYIGPTGYQSAFEPGEQATLDLFSSQTGARQLVWYSGWTTPTFGFNYPSDAVDTAIAPLPARFTPAGATVFSHVNTAGPLTISNAYTYLTTPLDSLTTPLLVDGAGHSLVATRQFSDGRETMALTFDSNPNLIHSLTLGYDLVNWVTRGTFLGERHAYMSPQIDDLFLANQMWTANTPCGTPIDSTTAEFRLRAKDYNTIIAWQRGLQAKALTSSVKLTWAFNGWGSYTKEYKPDNLSPAVVRDPSLFYFVSHTWDHAMLDAATAREVQDELVFNNLMGASLGLGADTRTLVTPNVSGLTNPNAMKTAYALGVRYIVTDTSQPGYNNPTPNTGIYNPLAPGVFMIPRYPTNLYFNVSTPAEWTAEYNCMYRSFWGRDFSYRDVLNNISDTWVTYLLNGDLNPLMFHQPNTRAYDGTHSLLGDLVDMTVAKYGQLVKFPILSPSMAAVGDKMIARQQYNEAGVTATLVPGTGLVLTAQKAAKVPVTGLKIAGAESYAGQSIAYVTLAAGQSKTIVVP
jgi:hypothetical protein